MIKQIVVGFVEVCCYSGRWVELAAVVMTVSSQSGVSQFETYGQTVLDSSSMNFVFSISGVIKLGDPCSELRGRRSKPDYRQLGQNTYLLFKSNIVKIA